MRHPIDAGVLVVDEKDPQTFRTGRFLFDGISVENLVSRTGWTQDQIEGVRAWAENYVSQRLEARGIEFDPSNADHIAEAAVLMLDGTERAEHTKLFEEAEEAQKVAATAQEGDGEHSAQD